MDGQRVTKPKDTRRRPTDAFKQTLIDRSLVPRTLVAAMAHDTGINAEQDATGRPLGLPAKDLRSRTPRLSPRSGAGCALRLNRPACCPQRVPSAAGLPSGDCWASYRQLQGGEIRSVSVG